MLKFYNTFREFAVLVTRKFDVPTMCTSQWVHSLREYLLNDFKHIYLFLLFHHLKKYLNFPTSYRGSRLPVAQEVISILITDVDFRLLCSLHVFTSVTITVGYVLVPSHRHHYAPADSGTNRRYCSVIYSR